LPSASNVEDVLVAAGLLVNLVDVNLLVNVQAAGYVAGGVASDATILQRRPAPAAESDAR
jgi:hypothetical protein